MSVIYFEGGSRVYVKESYIATEAKLKNHGVARGFVQFSRDTGDSREQPVSVNVARVTHFA